MISEETLSGDIQQSISLKTSCILSQLAGFPPSPKHENKNILFIQEDESVHHIDKTPITIMADRNSSLKSCLFQQEFSKSASGQKPDLRIIGYSVILISMDTIAQIGTRGQVTLPASARKQLGLKSGDTLICACRRWPDHS
jgi:hypothetical protein